MSRLLWSLAICLIPAVCVAQYRDPQNIRLDPAGLPGTLVIAGGGQLPDAARQLFLEKAGGTNARLVIIPTAGTDKALENYSIQSWQEAEPRPADVQLLHTRSRETANSDDFGRALSTATAVWFEGGSQDLIAAAYLGTEVEHQLQALLKRGGVVGGTSAGAAIMSRVMIARGNPVPEIETGFDLLPDSIIDQHFSERKRQPRLRAAVQQSPERFGLGLDEGTVVVVSGRDMTVMGSGNATIYLAPSTSRPERQISFQEGETTDLTRWRLAARARTEPAFPPSQPAETKLANGHLVIVGGGGLPDAILTRFIELAGGKDAPIVVLPTANPDPLPVPPRDDRMFLRAGCTRVLTLNQRTLADVTSPEFLKALEEAQGVWFGGGRQWRFMDAYAETPAADAIRGVLSRGGVIGGSSAGATIQGEYLVRGSPQGNQEMMAEGYERGLGFLPGVAIDQHFTQRKRLPDLQGVMQAHPQLLGIGLDEATAIIVSGQIADVLGAGSAHFLDPRRPDGTNTPISLPAGRQFDLIERIEITAPQAEASIVPDAPPLPQTVPLGPSSE